MSQKSEIYSAYKNAWEKNHPNVIQPEFYGGIGGKDFSSLDFTDSEYLGSHQFKAVKFFPEQIKKLKDGRVVEVGRTSSGNFPLAYVFPNLEAWENYAQPMSYNVFFDIW